MEKEFLPYELALRMKELGFEERCFTRYYESGKLADSLSYLHHNYFGQVNAPTFSQAVRWFREKYKIDFHVDRGFKYEYYYTILENGKNHPINGFYNNSYEEAELACLDKLIEIVEGRES